MATGGNLDAQATRVIAAAVVVVVVSTHTRHGTPGYMSLRGQNAIQRQLPLLLKLFASPAIPGVIARTARYYCLLTTLCFFIARAVFAACINVHNRCMC